MELCDRLWLGTVQIGKRYGLARRRQSRKESANLLDYAWEMGVRRFDTARNYGDSEERIGDWIAQTGNRPIVTSKVPRMDEIPDADIAAFVANCVEESRRDLHLDRLDVYLCHRHEDFERTSVRDALHEELARGRITRFGVSCYRPEEALKAMALDPATAFIQLPASLIDRRVQHSDLPASAAARNVTVAVRSLFLQGILLVAADRLPDHLARLAPVVSAVGEIAAGVGISPAALAIGYVLTRLPKADLVLGFHTNAQLREIERFQGNFTKYEPAYSELDQRIGNVDPFLVDPRGWPTP